MTRGDGVSLLQRCEAPVCVARVTSLHLASAGSLVVCVRRWCWMGGGSRARLWADARGVCARCARCALALALTRQDRLEVEVLTFVVYMLTSDILAAPSIRES